jgi:hypothetical protein
MRFCKVYSAPSGVTNWSQTTSGHLGLGIVWGLPSSLKVPLSWTPLAAVVARIFDIDAGPLAARPLHRKRI